METKPLFMPTASSSIVFLPEAALELDKEAILKQQVEAEQARAAQAEVEYQQAKLAARQAELEATYRQIVKEGSPAPAPATIPSDSPSIVFVKPADDVQEVVPVVSASAPTESVNAELLAQSAALVATTGQTTGVSLISPEGNVVFVGPQAQAEPTPTTEASGSCIKGSVVFAPIVTLPTAAELLPLRPDLQLPGEGTPWPKEPRSYVPPTSRCPCAACDESTDCLAEPERQLEGVEYRRYYRYGQNEDVVPAVAGGVSAAQAVGGVGKAILIGVATGTLIWATTKVLDRLFFSK